MNLLLPARVPMRTARLEQLVKSAHTTIDEATKLYKLSGFWALFSGGHDSLVNAHVCSKHSMFRGVIHIDTGTGLPETRQFVEDICKRYGWKLIVKSPAITYEMLIIKYGFPGAPSHRLMYQYLKERPLREARKGLGKIGMVSGVRKEESRIRMGRIEPHHKDKEGHWIAPIHDWTKLDCNAYLAHEFIQRSPVVDTMHMSGECFCGSFARPNEKRELEFWYPAQAKKIEAWQTLAQTAKDLGLATMTDNQCRWGHGRGVPDEQMELMPMCFFCRSNDKVAITEEAKVS